MDRAFGHSVAKPESEMEERGPDVGEKGALRPDRLTGVQLIGSAAWAAR